MKYQSKKTGDIIELNKSEGTECVQGLIEIIMLNILDIMPQPFWVGITELKLKRILSNYTITRNDTR